MKKLLSILLLLGVFSVYAANNNILCSIEYFYSDDSMLIGKAINGNRINYEYDLRGQLVSVKDPNGKVLESYTYDRVGNILSKTVNGKTTTYTYDKANQLISSTTDGKTTNYKYDAAGRMIQAGSKTYRYKYLDKVAEVRENGKVIAEFEYTVEGQVSTATYGDKTEEFMWDGLALIQRNDISYLNEPYVTGGNPILADNDVMFNDMLGNTVAINGKSVDMTAFGETENTDAMFTGKPHVAELGYAFLFRNYNSSLGKWSTADPLGYPDGWNNFVYCNNWTTTAIDWLGGNMWELYDKEAAIGNAGHSLPIVTFINPDGTWCAVGFDYAWGISSSSSSQSKKMSYGVTEMNALLQVVMHYNKNQKYEQLTLWGMNNYNSEQAYQKMTYEYEQPYSKAHNCLTITISGLIAGGYDDWFNEYMPTSPNDFKDIRSKGQNRTNLLKQLGE